jgi:hypothetical protein
LIDYLDMNSSIDLDPDFSSLNNSRNGTFSEGWVVCMRKAIHLVFPLNSDPYGVSWEEWAAIWCKWMLSLARDKNPSLDESGKNCRHDQSCAEVQFLGGSFGNENVIKRKCVVPSGKAILFPILEKEDSFVEDPDLNTEEELARRAKRAMDLVTHLDARIDGLKIGDLKKYRIRSNFFDLRFPKDNVYDVVPGTTRSVCDGYWVFLRPLPHGIHSIYFRGECLLPKGEVPTERIMNDRVYAPIKKFVNEFQKFKVEVEYELTVQ